MVKYFKGKRVHPKKQRIIPTLDRTEHKYTINLLNETGVTENSYKPYTYLVMGDGTKVGENTRDYASFVIAVTEYLKSKSFEVKPTDVISGPINVFDLSRMWAGGASKEYMQAIWNIYGPGSPPKVVEGETAETTTTGGTTTTTGVTFNVFDFMKLSLVEKREYIKNFINQYRQAKEMQNFNITDFLRLSPAEQVAFLKNVIQRYKETVEEVKEEYPFQIKPTPPTRNDIINQLKEMGVTSINYIPGTEIELTDGTKIGGNIYNYNDLITQLLNVSYKGYMISFSQAIPGAKTEYEKNILKSALGSAWTYAVNKLYSSKNAPTEGIIKPDVPEGFVGPVQQYYRIVIGQDASGTYYYTDIPYSTYLDLKNKKLVDQFRQTLYNKQILGKVSSFPIGDVSQKAFEKSYLKSWKQEEEAKGNVVYAINKNDLEKFYKYFEIDGEIPNNTWTAIATSKEQRDEYATGLECIAQAENLWNKVTKAGLLNLTAIRELLSEFGRTGLSGYNPLSVQYLQYYEDYKKGRITWQEFKDKFIRVASLTRFEQEYVRRGGPVEWLKHGFFNTFPGAVAVGEAMSLAIGFATGTVGGIIGTSARTFGGIAGKLFTGSFMTGATLGTFGILATGAGGLEAYKKGGREGLLSYGVKAGGAWAGAIAGGMAGYKSGYNYGLGMRKYHFTEYLGTKLFYTARKGFQFNPESKIHLFGKEYVYDPYGYFLPKYAGSSYVGTAGGGKGRGTTALVEYGLKPQTINYTSLTNISPKPYYGSAGDFLGTIPVTSNIEIVPYTGRVPNPMWKSSLFKARTAPAWKPYEVKTALQELKEYHMNKIQLSGKEALKPEVKKTEIEKTEIVETKEPNSSFKVKVLKKPGFFPSMETTTKPITSGPESPFKPIVKKRVYYRSFLEFLEAIEDGVTTSSAYWSEVRPVSGSQQQQVVQLQKRITETQEVISKHKQLVEQTTKELANLQNKLMQELRTKSLTTQETKTITELKKKIAMKQENLIGVKTALGEFIIILNNLSQKQMSLQSSLISSIQLQRETLAQSSMQGFSLASIQGLSQYQSQMNLQKQQLTQVQVSQQKLLQQQNLKLKMLKLSLLKNAFQTPYKFPKQESYDVFVKEKGMNVKITKKPLNKRTALGKGAYFADETPARTFYIKKSNKEPTKEPKYSMTWGLKQHKFRKPIRKGKEIKSDKRWIEKTKFAIDTGGEFKGITVKGLQKLREMKAMGIKPKKHKRRNKKTFFNLTGGI